MPDTPFSQQLETWLKGNDKKTLASLSNVFAEKSFAIAILVLMFFPALPLPTGGITHIFELITVLLALEMIAGRKTIWLPKKWKNKELGETFKGKTIPFIVRRVRWFEKFSRPRFRGLINHRYFARFAGVVILLFTLAAFVSPPFSGLDTLPALGAVIISLSLILGDAIIFLAGCVVGSAGIALTLILGEAALTAFKHFF